MRQAPAHKRSRNSMMRQALAHQRSRALAPTGCAANDMASARAQCLEHFQLPSITANARGQCLERPPLPRNAASIRAQCLESLALFARAVALRRAAGLSFFNSGFYKNVRQLQGFDALLLAGHMHFLVAVSIRTCDSCRDLTRPSGLPVAYQWLTSGLPVAYPVAYSPRLSFTYKRARGDLFFKHEFKGFLRIDAHRPFICKTRARGVSHWVSHW